MKKACRAFTLVEILVVLAIIGVLAAIIFPIGIRALAASRQGACLSNSRQLGLAAALYAGDNEDRTPGQTPYKPSAGRISFGYGWAGKIFPYVKAQKLFVCPEDHTAIDPRFAEPKASVVSYASNENLTSIAFSQATSASKTVFLFEVSNAYAQITLPDEGQNARGKQFTKLSPSGDGVKGDLIDYSNTPPSGHESLALYATGVMDNSDDDILADDYLGLPGRHSEGANYLALDGHEVFARPLTVSAGGDAKDAVHPQVTTGCPSIPGSRDTRWPCAAGTGEAGHKLTFSKI